MGAVAFTAPRRLEEADDLAGFSCGETSVDGWLAKHARHASKRGTAVVYVTFDKNDTLAGFYTLSAHSMDRNAMTGWLARNAPDQIPVILLGMLGVNGKHRGEGLGKQLLLDAYHRARRAAQTIGAKALVVDPLNADVAGFYLDAGFEKVPGSERLFARF